MVSLSPQILLAITKQLAKQADEAKRGPTVSQADEVSKHLDSIKSKPRTVDQQADILEEFDATVRGTKNQKRTGVEEGYDGGVEETFPSDEVIDGLYSKDGNLLVEGVESRILNEPTISETEHIKAFELDRSELFPLDTTRISNSKTRPATIQKKKGREFYKKKAIVEGDLSQSKGNYSSSPEFDTPIARTEDTAGFNPLDAANVPIRANEIVNPNRQKAAGLDLEGEKIGMQMDKIQEIIDKDSFLRALGEDDIKDLMPSIISKNRNKLNIKDDVRQVSTSVFEKLNDLAESAATDPDLSKQIQVMRAQAAQANERNDYKTLQLMLEQLTGTDAGLEGLSRFGRGRPTIPDDPTSLPINVPSKDKTATMEQIMKAVTQELGIK